MTTDLVDRLRDLAGGHETNADQHPDVITMLREAADRLESLTKPLSDEKVGEIRAALEKITPGEWAVVETHGKRSVRIKVAREYGTVAQITACLHREANATFIAHAPAWIRDLLSDRETLIRERDEARAALESARGDTLARFGGKEPFGCHARLDGECNWEHCPQRANYQPHCPRDIRCGDPSCDAVENANAAIRSMKGE